VIKKLLEAHIERFHSVENQCDVCGADCETKTGEADHMEKHKANLNPFACVICSAEFTNTISLKQHVTMEHGSEKFKCEFCGKIFTKALSLKGHMKYHVDVEARKCSICEKICQSKSHLETHLTSHSGERKYCCEICGRSYPYKKGLIRHQKVHTGEAPFKCKICGNAFAESSFLKRHEEIHSGTQMYSCDLCGKRFQTSHGLWQHSRTHMDLPKKKRARPRRLKKLGPNSGGNLDLFGRVCSEEQAKLKAQRNLKDSSSSITAPAAFGSFVGTVPDVERWKGQNELNNSVSGENQRMSTVHFNEPIRFEYQEQSGKLKVHAYILLSKI